MRHGPRQDSRGILDPDRLMRRVGFRRHLPTAALRPYVEHYWLIDWDLAEPFEQQVVPHPSVNAVFQQFDPGPETAEIAGVSQELFSIKLAGTGRVSGVQFRPGGFRPFWKRSVAELTNRRVSLQAGPVCAGTDDDRSQALDAFLLDRCPEPDPLADEAMALAELIRTDRSVLRVDAIARRVGLPTRRLQRLFIEYVGVSPKWVIRRYRIQEAVERAAGGPPDWASLAADLGFSDQAHLVREFTAVIGMPPGAYARLIE